jgi:hypothetical protein
MREIVVGVPVRVADGVDPDGLVPEARRLLVWAVAYLEHALPGRWIVVTSARRRDGIHATGRAVDLDVEGLDERDPETIRAVLNLAAATELLWPYRSRTGTRHACVWDTDDQHRGHIHLQVPPRSRGSG